MPAKKSKNNLNKGQGRTDPHKSSAKPGSVWGRFNAEPSLTEKLTSFLPFSPSRNNFHDPRQGQFLSYHSTGEDGKEIHITAKHCPLETFLNSQEKDDCDLLTRLKASLSIKDLNLRLKENFSNSRVNPALQLEYADGVRNDQLLWDVLELLLLSNEVILSLPLITIENYNEKQKNYLCLRLAYISPPELPFKEGTLGAFLTNQEIQSLQGIYDSLYFLFTREQILLILKSRDIEKKQIKLEAHNQLV